MTIAQSPLSALRASSGDWLIVTLGLQEISSLLILRPEDLYSPTLPDKAVQGKQSLVFKVGQMSDQHSKSSNFLEKKGFLKLKDI